ncbi:MAG: c-type cytochrome [Ginsengibacter sp.]
MKTKTIVSLLLTGFVAASFTFKENFQKKPWVIPDVAKNKKNPVPKDAAGTATGKALWVTHCKSCHGAKGLGDGPKAAELKSEVGDLSKADVQAKTDGTFFYELSEGHGDMPAFKKKIADEDDRWSIVNYMRTLKK